MSVRKMKCPRCAFEYEAIFESKLKRSNPQNAYLHGVVLPILAKKTGYSQIEMKDMVKSLFLKKTVEVGGRTIEIVAGSSELKTDEFELFIEKIRAWSGNVLDCYIPKPNEIGPNK